MSSYRTSKVDEAYYDVFTVFDTDGLTPKTGETVFAVSFTKDGGVETPTFVVAEIGTSGTYLLTVAAGFDAGGLWVVTVVPDFNDSTWRSEVEVRVNDIDDVYDAVIVGGSGAETVTLTVVDTLSGNAPIPDALIQIYDDTGVVLVTFQRTDTSGEAVFLLDADDYVIRVFKPGTSCPDTPITVADTGGATPQDFQIDCESITVVPPSSPNLCRMYADFVTMAGAPFEKFKLSVENLYDPSNPAGFAVVQKSIQYETDAAGHIEFDVVRGTRIRVVFATSILSRDLVVPDQPVASLLTAFGVATDAFTIVTE